MGKLLHLFGKAPEPQPEAASFDFYTELADLLGILHDLEQSEGPTEAILILQRANERVRDWPDG